MYWRPYGQNPIDYSQFSTACSSAPSLTCNFWKMISRTMVSFAVKRTELTGSNVMQLYLAFLGGQTMPQTWTTLALYSHMRGAWNVSVLTGCPYKAD